MNLSKIHTRLEIFVQRAKESGTNLLPVLTAALKERFLNNKPCVVWRRNTVVTSKFGREVI